MGSVGACRQCAVRQYKDADDDKGMLVMSCMSPATDQTRISIDDEEAKAFRASVVEWLMINHPTTARCARRAATAICRT